MLNIVCVCVEFGLERCPKVVPSDDHNIFYLLSNLKTDRNTDEAADMSRPAVFNSQYLNTPKDAPCENLAVEAYLKDFLQPWIQPRNFACCFLVKPCIASP